MKTMASSVTDKTNHSTSYLHSTPLGDVHVFGSIALPSTFVVSLFGEQLIPRFGLILSVS